MASLVAISLGAKYSITMGLDIVSPIYASSAGTTLGPFNRVQSPPHSLQNVITNAPSPMSSLASSLMLSLESALLGSASPSALRFLLLLVLSTAQLKPIVYDIGAPSQLLRSNLRVINWFTGSEISAIRTVGSAYTSRVHTTTQAYMSCMTVT